MFLDSLSSTLTSSTPGSIITSTSHHESSTHVSSSSRSEAGVITSAPDIISLDWGKGQHAGLWDALHRAAAALSLELQHLASYSDIYWKDLTCGEWNKFTYIRTISDRSFFFSFSVAHWIVGIEKVPSDHAFMLSACSGETDDLLLGGFNKCFSILL